MVGVVLILSVTKKQMNVYARNVTLEIHTMDVNVSVNCYYLCEPKYDKDSLLNRIWLNSTGVASIYHCVKRFDWSFILHMYVIFV